MSDSPIKPLLSAEYAPRLDLSRPVTPNLALAGGEDFSTLLSSMLSASAMLGSGSGSSGLPGSGMDMSMLVYTLFEQMLSSQMNLGQTAGLQAFGKAGLLGGPPSPVPHGDPLAGKGRLTQDYHGRHNGLDWGVPVGTPVQSTMDGKVVYAGWNDEGYGNLVIVENGPYRTYYAHLSEVPVSVGQDVRRGTVIGLSGNTGNSTGPHLHYEVRYQHEALNPDTTLA